MSKTNSARKEIDIIDMLSYDSGHAAGYVEGRMDGYEIGYKECAKKYRKMKKIRKKRLCSFYRIIVCQNALEFCFLYLRYLQ